MRLLGTMAANDAMAAYIVAQSKRGAAAGEDDASEGGGDREGRGGHGGREGDGGDGGDGGRDSLKTLHLLARGDTCLVLDVPIYGEQREQGAARRPAAGTSRAVTLTLRPVRLATASPFDVTAPPAPPAPPVPVSPSPSWPAPPAEQTTVLPPWIFAVCGGAAVAVLVALLLLVRYRRKYRDLYARGGFSLLRDIESANQDASDRAWESLIRGTPSSGGFSGGGGGGLVYDAFNAPVAGGGVGGVASKGMHKQQLQHWADAGVAVGGGGGSSNSGGSGGSDSSLSPSALGRRRSSPKSMPTSPKSAHHHHRQHGGGGGGGGDGDHPHHHHGPIPNQQRTGTQTKRPAGVQQALECEQSHPAVHHLALSAARPQVRLAMPKDSRDENAAPATYRNRPLTLGQKYGRNQLESREPLHRA